MNQRPPSLPARRTIPGLLATLLLLCAVLPLPARAAEPGTRPPEANADELLQPRLARELARLDERLELDTFPDGSGLWLSRVAAALEYRLRAEDASLPAADLLRRLAAELQGRGMDRDLEGSPRGGGVAGPGIVAPRPPAAAEAADPRRTERLRLLLATVDLVHAKLDRAATAAAAGHHAAAFAAPGNDDCAAASVIGDGTVSGSTDGASADGAASCDGGTPPLDVWFRYTAATDGPAVFDTFGSSFDTVLSVFDGCPDDGRETELACNDDAAGGSAQSRITLDMSAGQEVWVRLGGFAGGTGSYELNVGPDVGIAGTVTRADTGAPLAGVRVGLYYGYGYYLDDTLTAADGTYRFAGLDDNTYYVRTLDASGFVDEIWDDVACPSYSYCYADDGTPIPVSGNLVSGIDLALSPAGEITGTVTDPAAAPLSAYVYLHSLAGTSLRTIYTGSGGEYTSGGLPPGKYYLRSEASGYQAELYDDLPCGYPCDVTTGTQVVATAGATISGVDFALDRLGGVSGTLTEDPSGAPLQSVRVRAVRENGANAGYVYTLSDGTYTLSQLSPASYWIYTDTDSHQDEIYDDVPCTDLCYVAEATLIPVAVNETVTGIDFALRPLGAISGTVRHSVSGSAVGNVRVKAYDASTSQYFWYSYTATDGTYRIANLPSGSYHLRVEDNRYVDELYHDVSCLPSCSLATGTPVSVSLATTTTGIDFYLDRLGILAGAVSAADTGLGLSSDIVLYDADGNPLTYVYSTSYYGYTIDGLLPGIYYVKTSRYDGYLPDYQDELFDDVPCEPACDLSAGTPLVVALNGSLSGVDFTLRLCPADTYQQISGTTFLSTNSIEACERVTASSGTTVSAGADVTFKAGRAVVLGSGFSVAAGGTFQVVIDPTWAKE